MWQLRCAFWKYCTTWFEHFGFGRNPYIWRQAVTELFVVNLVCIFWNRAIGWAIIYVKSIPWRRRSLSVLNVLWIQERASSHAESYELSVLWPPFCSEDVFADVHNLDHCIKYLNQSLVTFGFPSGLNLYSSDPVRFMRSDLSFCKFFGMLLSVESHRFQDVVC